jgi:peptidoglycan/LPS O-acetylase OafA/YrhL
MNTCNAGGRQRFETLDALRGLAALAVVSGHTQDLFGGSIFPLGYLAVDFFFMLSGFVLAYAYGQRVEGGLTVGHFMKARLIRFYALYLIGLAIAVLAMLIERAQGMVWYIGRSSYTEPSWNYSFFLFPASRRSHSFR